MDLVCQNLDVESVSSALLCNVHLLMMFQNKIKLLFEQIHDTLGKKKIKDCFLVDVDFHSESFVLKAIKCLSNFINKDYSCKKWNRYNHFSDFIKPKENMSLSLKDHRFNRLNDCCLSIIYHLYDIASYFEKFSSVNNGITILERSFIDIEVLKRIFAAVSLMGVQITRPFHYLLMDTSTTYSTILEAFPMLYDELTKVQPHEAMQLDHQIFKFVPEKIYKMSLPDQCLIDYLKVCINTYTNEIKSLLKILFKMCAEGFALQK